MNGPKIIITGSGGFIFSHFTSRAFKDRLPYKISGVDGSFLPSLYSFYVNKNYNQHLVDICDYRMLSKIFEIEKPDIVIHAAALNFGSESDLLKTNILGTQNVITACQEHKVNRLIFISSCHVYQPLSNLQQEVLTEDSPLSPSSTYAISKLTSEYLIRQSGLNYQILRPCNIYGIAQSIEALVPKLINHLSNNLEMTLTPDHCNEWMYVEDMYLSLLTILEKGEPNQIYNISGNLEFSNKEILELLIKTLEIQNHKITMEPERPERMIRFALDSTKLRKLGWSPNYKIRNGLNLTTNWYVANPWIWKK